MSNEDDSNNKPKADSEEGEEECGFCIFMKGGGCKESFTNWSKCVDEHREGSKDFTEECKDSTIALQDCMMEHKDYYKDFIGLADGAEGEKSGDPGKSGPNSKDDVNKDGKESNTDDQKDDSGDKADDSSDQKQEGDKKEDSSKEDEGENKDNSSNKSDKGSDPNTSKRLDDTPAEKHNKASEDSESKQARTHEQETNPVKARPDQGKKEEAANEPPRPQREENKQEAKEEDKPEGNNSEGGEEEEEEEEEDDTPHIVVQTAPYDRRFVTTNQARHCYTRYQEYHRCVAQEGEESKSCSFFQKAYRAICPGDWVDNWNEQREEGTFPGRY